MNFPVYGLNDYYVIFYKTLYNTGIRANEFRIPVIIKVVHVFSPLLRLVKNLNNVSFIPLPSPYKKK